MRPVARVIPAVAKHLFIAFVVLPVPAEEPDRPRLGANRDVAFDPIGADLPIVVDHLDVHPRRRPPHRSGFDLERRIVGDQAHRLRLAVPVIGHRTGGGLPRCDHFGI